MSRFILHFTGSGAVPAADLKQIRGCSGLTVLDESPRMMLVQATPQTVGRLVKELPGWKSSAEQFIPLPDTKVKVKQKP
jgi:hypothetical protein